MSKPPLASFVQAADTAGKLTSVAGQHTSGTIQPRIFAAPRAGLRIRVAKGTEQPA